MLVSLRSQNQLSFVCSVFLKLASCSSLMCSCFGILKVKSSCKRMCSPPLLTTVTMSTPIQPHATVPTCLWFTSCCHGDGIFLSNPTSGSGLHVGMWGRKGEEKKWSLLLISVRTQRNLLVAMSLRWGFVGCFCIAKWSMWNHKLPFL